jgi:hypothetical protein
MWRPGNSIVTDSCYACRQDEESNALISKKAALLGLILGMTVGGVHAAGNLREPSAEPSASAAMGAQLELPLTSSTSLNLEYLRAQPVDAQAPLVNVDQSMATTIKLGVRLRFAE